MARALPPTFSEAKELADSLWAASRAAGEAMRAFPKQGPMGLTPDAVKATAEWTAAKAKADLAAHELRAYNEVYTKTFAADIRAERDARRRVAKPC